MMERTVVYKALLVAVACCGLPLGPAQAQTFIPKPEGSEIPPNPDPKNFEGMWKGAPSDHAVAAGYKDPGENAGPDAGPAPPVARPDGPGGPSANTLPLKPEVAARAKEFRELTLKGTSPVTWRLVCRPGTGVSGLGDDIGGGEIIQTPTRVLFLFDTDNTYFEVYLDRQHSAKVTPSYGGHSIGHWEGDKLVIDTIGYNGRNTIVTGAKTNAKTHTVTTMWKEDGGNKLSWQVYVEDPENLTAPGNMPVRSTYWRPDHRIYEEHCSQAGAKPENLSDMVFQDFTREQAFPYLAKNKK